jgi:GTP-binding protein
MRFPVFSVLTFVLGPLVVLNKADRVTSRPAQVESYLFDLSATLERRPIKRTIPPPRLRKTRLGSRHPPDTQHRSRFVQHDHDLGIPAHPETRTSPKPLRPYGALLNAHSPSDPYVGMLLRGRVHSGILKPGDTLWALDPEGNQVGKARLRRYLGEGGGEG